MDHVQNKIEENSGELGTTSRRQIEILFEFLVPSKKPCIYRGVKGIDASFRMEKKGLQAKAFRTVMSCGAVESLFRFRESLDPSFQK